MKTIYLYTYTCIGMYVSRIHQNKDAEDSCLHSYGLKLFTVKETHKIILTETCKFCASHRQHLHCSADIKMYFKDDCLCSHPRTSTLGRRCCKSWPSGVVYVIFFPPFWYINHFLILFLFYQTNLALYESVMLGIPLIYENCILLFFKLRCWLCNSANLENFLWHLMQFSPASLENLAGCLEM